MRFVWAVVAFALATVFLGAGTAQRTVFVGPSEQRRELSVDDGQPYVLVDAEVLSAHEGLQTLLVRGKGDIFVAYGRTADMTAWLSDTSYTHVTLSKGKAKSTLVDAANPPADGATTSGRNPAGSDLWLDSFVEKDSLVTEMQLTEGHSVLIARDGVQPAPSDILVSWGLDNRTPLAGPLIVAGGIVLLAGLVLYILAIRHQRRGRGPRRKGPGPLPETEPLALADIPKREAIAPADETSTDAGEAPDAGKAERTVINRRRRMALGLPAVALTAVLATGCSPDMWPDIGASTPTPTPTPTVVTPEGQKPAVVTQQQGQRIVSQIAETLTKADAELDIDLAETRMAGAALEVRRTEYTLREKIADREGEQTLPRDKVKILLPEATDSWPRSVMALTVSEKDDTVPPVLMTMTQQDPWSPYQVVQIGDMPASVRFPEVAPEWLGTTRVPADSPFLSMPPSELSTAFTDLVDGADKSAYAGRFDEITDNLAASIRESRAGVIKRLAEQKSDKTSKVAFDMKVDETEPLSMATLDSGAIVTVRAFETETITPTTPDAMIRTEHNPQAKALTGLGESAKGFISAYSMQLVFAVPAQSSNEQIRLLAYDQDLLSVKVIK